MELEHHPINRTPGGQAQVEGKWLTVSSNLDPRLGGVSAMLPGLMESLGRNGFEMSLAAFCSHGEDISSAAGKAVRHRSYPLKGLRSLFDNQTRSQLTRDMAPMSGVHVHCIWQPHCAMAASLAYAQRKPYIISAHGMVDLWALRQKRIKKRVYFELVEKNSLRRASCLHALTESEREGYRRLAPGVPVVVIPNGVGDPPHATPDLFLSQYPVLRGKRIVLFLARIHPKKGLDMLCDAWRDLSGSYPDAHLVIAGPDSQGYRGELENRVAALGIASRVLFTGMLAGLVKWSAFKSASVYVLPSYSEGLSVAALEAMSMSLPVIVTEQCHVQGVREMRCGWQIQPEIGEIATAISDFLATGTDTAQAMGRRAHQLVSNRYNWDVIGRHMAGVYRWVSGGPRPQDILIQ